MISVYNNPMKMPMVYLLSVLFAAFGLMSSSAQAQDRPVRIVVFGDSITANDQLAPEQSFSKILERKLLGDGYLTEVISMSLSGETTASARSRLGAMMDARPDILIIQLGYNDALMGINPRRVTHRNLYHIANAAHKKNIGLLVLGVKAPKGKSKAFVAQFNAAYRSIALSGVSVYPDILKGLHDRPDLTLADGVHPNENGVLAMVHNVYRYVTPLVKWRIDLQNYYKRSM